MVFYSYMQYSRYIYRYIGAISHGILLLAAVFKVYIDISELYHMGFYS